MKYLLLILFSIAAAKSTAQKIRFTDTSNRWKIESQVGQIGEMTQELAIMKMGADTVFHGLTYKRPEILYYSFCQDQYGGGVHCDFSGTPGPKITGGYYREDTVLNRVYCLSTWTGDTVEHIIYDGAWQIGDTVTWGDGATAIKKSIVFGYDSAFLFGVWHRAFKMTYAPHPGSNVYFIVEGIGCLKGPGYPVHAVAPFENGDWLRCFERAGDRPAFALASGFNQGLNTDYSCNVAPLAVKEITASAVPKLVPNPGDSKTILQTGTVRSGSVWLADATGRLIASFDFQGKSELPIGQWLNMPGVYFYSLRDALNGQRFTGSFTFR